MRIKDIVNIRNEKIQQTDLPYIALENIRSWDATFIETDAATEGINNIFKKGDILFGKLRPYLAKGYIPEYDGICSSEFLVMFAKKGYSNRYLLYYFLSHSVIDYIRNQVAGVKMPRTNWSSFSSIEIEPPTLADQQRIVDYLDEKTKAIDGRISVLEKKSDAYTRLKASVINRAVTRGLNPNVTLKDSGIEWIGMIPEHWEIKRYKEFITLQKGKTPKELSYESVGLPYLTMDYLRDRDGKSTVYPESVEGLLEISANEIIVLWDGANAGEFIKSKAGYLGSTMALLLTKGISKNYLYYFLKSIERDSKYYSNGTTIPHFDSGILLNREYPVPPYSEQQAIANYLDAKCSEIDKAIENIDKQIDALNRLKRSLINEVVTGKRKV